MNAIIKDNKMYPALIFSNPKLISAISHPIRIKIVEMLSENPMYPIEIARELNLVEQKVYYHINVLKNAGVIKEIEVKQMRGVKARLLKPVALAFGFVMKGAKGGEFFKGEEFHPFVKDGVVDAKLIVGSPDPHGKHRARARDLHIAAEVSAFFARMGTVPWPFVYEDVELKSLKGNLILLGGPIVNMVSAKLNNAFPVKFVDRMIKSPKKEYTEDWAGFVAMAENPEDKGAKVMIIAGRTRSGTRAAALGLRKFFNELKEKNYVVVQGFDEDGDGIVDSVELIE